VPTAGAVESVAGLRDPKSGISIAIVPSGIIDQHESRGLLSLGTLFYEPLWFSGAAVLAADDVNLATIAKADAWVALYPFLSKVVVPAGVGDIVHNRPPTDVVLLAPKASLVVRSDLHPAIQYLLLEAAAKIHSGPGIFRKAGEFPAPESIDVPLSGHARQFYKSGPPFLQRSLPFWLAVLVQQLLVVLIPVAGVLYPVVQFSPSAYDWFIERRVFKLYDELQLIEDQLASDSAGKQMVDDVLARLDRLDKRASSLQIPASYRPMLYALR